MGKSLDRLQRRLRELGLSLSLWDLAGAPLSEPALHRELCCRLCGEKRLSLEAMAELARGVCTNKQARIDTTPTGCCMLAVPICQRRRLAGSAVACFPSLQTPQSEEFARACGNAALDVEYMRRLCREEDLHDAREAQALCRVLEWLVADEQAKEVAGGELATLSTNLANTYEELSLLYRISGSMKLTQSATEFFTSLCQEVLEVMRLQAAAAVLYPREHGDSGEEVVFAGEMPLTAGQLAEVIREHLAPRFGSSTRAIVENQFSGQAGPLGPAVEDIHTLVAVPLMAAEHCKGVLIGINKIAAEFDSVDLKLISSISSQAAAFLENHHLYEDLQDLLMGMLHALTASIDAKDPYTRGHSQRVALISRRLADLAGLDADRVQRVYLAGLLHDIGKIGVPEEVLLKAGRLTDAEYDKVKRHPEISATILSGIRQMQDIIPAILYHHERLDGRGYPHRLCGPDVPLEALIVGLADSFDAMTSSRTYRDAMPLEDVVAEIRRWEGTQFDSHLVRLLLSVDLEKFLGELREASVAAEMLAKR